ncbi:vomeronasal 1 receptor ornAnaV1R3263 [Ornithorhynchus anatinus]|uniref:Vomeronasal type-1 receptor n=1 Tax=Ornithorhynchus anatinus TaxID=9258 RepID=A0A6I8MY91_ORNAN|nr:vomeronasal 1 receptor ornAnaV1R3263 [Ornithorhynchus anatinus]
MDASEISYGILLLLQIIIEISRNVFLLLVYARVVFTSHKMYPLDFIFSQLALSNSITLVSFGIPETMSAWGLRNFLNAIGCKIVFYVHRVGRGLVISTTCFLSIFQAITISPATSWWAGAKVSLPKCILPSYLFSWVLSLLIDVTTLLNMDRPLNFTNNQRTFITKYCSSVNVSEVTTLVNAVVLSLRDLFFGGLMSAASGYMVLLLHMHHRQVQHLHGPGRSLGMMPEIRAAKNVVALVTLYILLYGQETDTLSILINERKKSPHLVNYFKMLASTFSVISPFLIIHNKQRMRMFGRRTSPISNLHPSPALKEVA